MGFIERIIQEKIRRHGIRKLTLIIFLSTFFTGWILEVSKTIGVWLVERQRWGSWFSAIFNKVPSWLTELLAWDFDLPYELSKILGITIFIFLSLVIIEALEYDSPDRPIVVLRRWLRRRVLTIDRSITSIPCLLDWMYQGSLKICKHPERSLEITSSNSGALMRYFQFRDFVMSFKAKICNGGGFAIIFRAQDLEDYLMLQIGIRDPYKHERANLEKWRSRYPSHIVITPHIRFLGNFETYNIDSGEPYFATNLRFADGYEPCHSNRDRSYQSHDKLCVSLYVKDNVALLKINNEKVFRWNIPTHIEPNILQRPQNSQEFLDDQFTSKLWFRNRYGRVGFRAYGLEKAIIYDLRVDPLEKHWEQIRRWGDQTAQEFGMSHEDQVEEVIDEIRR